MYGKEMDWRGKESKFLQKLLTTFWCYFNYTPNKIVKIFLASFQVLESKDLFAQKLNIDQKVGVNVGSSTCEHKVFPQS